MEIKVGCDPEFFLWDKKLKKYHSAHAAIPGTKDDPYPVECGAIQVDGTAVEFNINPASSAEEFTHNIRTVLAYLRKEIPKRYEFRFKPSVLYNQEDWDAIPEHAKRLGCDPDFSAFNKGRENNPPEPIGTMRTGSGHVHVGWTQGKDPRSPVHFDDCIEVVKNLDRAYKSFDWVFDKDHERAKMYGAEGSFRPKSYGVEYRTPSNAWVAYPKLHAWMFELVSSVIRTMEDGRVVQYYGFYDFDDTPPVATARKHYSRGGCYPAPFPPEHWKSDRVK